MKRSENYVMALILGGVMAGALGFLLGGCTGCDRVERIPAQVERLPNRWGSMRIREMRELRKKVL
jgi:hypothetical protein